MSVGESEARTLARERIVLALLFFATAVNYLDRQTLSVAAPLLHQELGITSIGYSRIVFFFLLGYTISQTLAGKVIDRIGTRLGMLLCVVLWSAVTMLHSLAVGAVSLGILRTCLGLTEAGNWPGVLKPSARIFRRNAVGSPPEYSIAGPRQARSWPLRWLPPSCDSGAGALCSQ